MGKTWCFEIAVSEKHHDETMCCCALVKFVFTRGLLYYQIWSRWGRKPATKAQRVCLIAQRTAGEGRETAANLEESVRLLNVITGFLQNWVSHCRTWVQCMSVSGAKLKIRSAEAVTLWASVNTTISVSTMVYFASAGKTILRHDNTDAHCQKAKGNVLNCDESKRKCSS